MTEQTFRRRLTRLAAWTLAPAAVVGLAAGAPALAQASSTLAAVQAHLKSTSSMTADFVQTDRNGQRLSGALTLKRPGKIRFQYQKGVPMLIVGDGSALTMIDYEVKQVQRWPVKNSPLGALLDPDRDLSKYAKVLPTDSSDVLSVEVHDPKRPEYGTITMVFIRDAAAPAGLRLRGWVALDSQNNRTRIDLSNQKFNVAVADSAFRWTDPRPKKRGGR
ncbi:MULTISPECIES: LolA family protein [Sphingopyxis]|uniref:LolA family protein n=1 Tax=Sphingopyxis TaxID=165697 RepID=UPI000958A447|nr:MULTISPECIES: outer membrane lipoprotein carrier protein LolA [Sphingopyxis]APW73809.1 cell envelope biogenesis protein LolA [Sphingopyxis granuli]AVA15133.1 outer membrane lipoprotein carrier protein LolA [Sphingopyxis sp. MG]